jgi:hypothetical protein
MTQAQLLPTTNGQLAGELQLIFKPYIAFTGSLVVPEITVDSVETAQT